MVPPPSPLRAHPLPAEGRATQLRALVSSSAVGELARERFVPLAPSIAALLATPGLRRGSTVVLEGGATSGSTSLALALLAEATASGRWCALFGALAPRPDADGPSARGGETRGGEARATVGLAAAAELGVRLERLVVVPAVPGREAMFLATLLEACDIVLAALSRPLSALDARRLAARARERHSVLVVFAAPALTPVPVRRLWPETGDLTLPVTGGRVVGLGEGEGRISARLLEITASGRREMSGGRHLGLWLPARDGTLRTDGAPESVGPAAADRPSVALRS
jgi:hypothetical protein